MIFELGHYDIYVTNANYNEKYSNTMKYNVRHLER